MKLDFPDAAVRTRIHPAKIVHDFQKADGQGFELSAHLHRRVDRGLSFEMIPRFGERNAGQLRHFRRETGSEFRMRIDARSHRGSALRQFLDAG